MSVSPFIRHVFHVSHDYPHARAHARESVTDKSVKYVTATSPEGNAAYLSGLCVDCRAARYSPGRPRCNECHRTRLNITAGYDR